MQPLRRLFALRTRNLFNHSAPILFSNEKLLLKPLSSSRKHTTLTKRADEEISKFNAIFPKLVQDLTKSEEYPEVDIREVFAWFEKVINYNVPGGKKTRGTTVPLSYQLLLKGKATEENIHLARVAGWCLEILHGSMVINDDIMDESQTRRGQQCWYKVKNVGIPNAMIDSSFLDTSVHLLFRKYFREKPYYQDLLDLIQNTKMQTTLGQHVDTHCLYEDNRPKLDLFNMERYNAITKFKAAYTFQQPIAIAMLMAGVTDLTLHRQAEKVLIKIGHLFQVQDDYMDCFGDPKKMGKEGSDIESGKCTWLVVVARGKCNSEQGKILEENYGRNDPEKVARIKQLYEELRLPEAFRAYEEEVSQAIFKEIEEIPQSHLPHELFTNPMKRIYRRRR